MTDHDALLNAIIADPDDDTARLVYADFIEEAGEAERAAFIRDQIQLAREPEWGPFATRWRRNDLATQAGDRFRPNLPWADAWNPRFPFRRGFGYSIKTTSVGQLVEAGDELFASAPIGELYLPGGDMSEYVEFARQSWLSRVEGVRFYPGRTPTEPIRALCDSPVPTRLKAIHFERASSAGMWTLVEGLFQSPLGRQLRELSFHVGDGSQLDLIEAFEAGGPPNLERLTFDNMGLDSLSLERLTRSPVLPTLRELTFRDMFFNGPQLGLVLRCATHVEALTLRKMNYRTRAGGRLTGLAPLARFHRLRRLDLSGTYGLRHHLRGLTAKPLHTLRSVGLGNMNLGSLDPDEDFLPQFVDAPCWPGLVELDLSGNSLGDRAARQLLAAIRPPDLTTLDLRGNRMIDPRVRGQLRDHFGDAVLLD